MSGSILRRVFRALLFSSVCIILSGPVSAQVVISEILYDASGTDAGSVFVELFGPPGMSLAGFTLEGVNGGNGLVYKTVTLTGSIGSEGVFVVADDAGGGITSVVNFDLVVDVDFQNGPDSVRLVQGATVLDAVGYGGFTSAIFAGEGQPALDPAAGSSLARLPGLTGFLLDTDDNLNDFSVLTVPTPGVVPVTAVPLPSAVWLFLSGLGWLARTARKR